MCLPPLGFQRGFGLPELADCCSIAILGGSLRPESQTAALDLESKLIEAGLVSVQLSDYRNFAHGGIIDCEKSQYRCGGPGHERRDFARVEHLALLPSTVQKLLLKTEYSASLASMAALQQPCLRLVAEYVESQKIDPVARGVLPLGARLSLQCISTSRKKP